MTDGKQRIGENWTAEQWRQVAARNLDAAVAERRLKLEAEAKVETLSREIERVKAVVAKWENGGHDEARFQADCGICQLMRDLRYSLTTGSAAGEDT